MRAIFIATYQVHNKLNNTHLALMHYSWAMDLDPKVHSTRTKTMPSIMAQEPSKKTMPSIIAQPLL